VPRVKHWKKQTLALHYLPFFVLVAKFVSVKSIPELWLHLDRMSNAIIFTKLKPTFITSSRSRYLFEDGFLRYKVGFVFLSEADFQNKMSETSPTPLLISHVTFDGRNSSQHEQYMLSNVSFNPRALKVYVSYFDKLRSRSDNFMLLSKTKIIQLMVQVPTINHIHPIVISKIASESLNSDYLREFLDMLSLFTLIKFRNGSIGLKQDGEMTSAGDLRSSKADVTVPELIGLQEVILLERITHSFITCYTNPITFVNFFVPPLQVNVWIFFILSAIIITLLWLQISWFHVEKKNKSFSPTLLMVSSISDDCCGIPGWFDKILAFRLSFVGWSLAMIVVVNGYIGGLISGLSTPYDLFSITSFADLSNQHYSYQEITKNKYWKYMGCFDHFIEQSFVYKCRHNPELSSKPRMFRPEIEFRLLSSPISPTDLSIPTSDDQGQSRKTETLCNQTTIQWEISSFLNKLLRFDQNAKYCESRPTLLYFRNMCLQKNKLNIRLQVLLFNLIYPSHNGIPQSAINLVVRDPEDARKCVLSDANQFELEVEEELLKCEKTVFVDEHSKVLREHEYLGKQHPKVKFFASTEQIWPFQRCWTLKIRDGHALVKDIQTFMSNGIYFRTLDYFETFKYYDRSRKTQERKNIKRLSTHQPEKQKMDGKFKTVFEIFACMNMVCCLIFLLQNCYKALIVDPEYIVTKILNFLCLICEILYTLQFSPNLIYVKRHAYHSSFLYF